MRWIQWAITKPDDMTSKLLRWDLKKVGGLEVFNGIYIGKKIPSRGRGVVREKPNLFNYSAYLIQEWGYIMRKNNPKITSMTRIWNNEQCLASNKEPVQSIWLNKWGFGRIQDFVDNRGNIVSVQEAMNRGLPWKAAFEWQAAIHTIRPVVDLQLIRQQEDGM